MLHEASRAFWLDALAGEAGSVCGVKLPIDDAGLAAVVGIDAEGRVSGDPPAIEACDLLPFSPGVAWVFGVADLRPELP